MAGNALYDVGMRLRAAELHDEGHGRAAIAALLGMPEETVREWLCTYRSAGIEVLAMMGKKHTAYSFETKLAAVRAVVDEGMTKPEAMEKFGIASPSPFKKQVFLIAFIFKKSRDKSFGFHDDCFAS